MATQFRYEDCETFRLDAIINRLLNTPKDEKAKFTDTPWDLVEGTKKRPVFFTRTYKVSYGSPELQQHKFYFDGEHRAVEVTVYRDRVIELERYGGGLLTGSVERTRFGDKPKDRWQKDDRSWNTIWVAYDSNGRTIDQRLDSPNGERSYRVVQSFPNYQTQERIEGADYLARERSGDLDAFRLAVVSGMVESIVKASGHNPAIRDLHDELKENPSKLLAVYEELANPRRGAESFMRQRASVPEMIEFVFAVADRLQGAGLVEQRNNLMNQYFYQNRL